MRSMVEIVERELFKDLDGKGIFVDLLLGSGYEALEMSKHCPNGMVYAFGGGSDIETTCKLFESVERDNIRLINDTPDNMEIYMVFKIDCAICRVDNNCNVTEEQVLRAISITLNNLNVGGRLLVLLKKRNAKICEILSAISYREFLTIEFSSLNDIDSPTGILIERR